MAMQNNYNFNHINNDFPKKTFDRKKRLAVTGLGLVLFGLFGLSFYLLSSSGVIKNPFQKNKTSQISEVKIEKAKMALKENKIKEVKVPIGESKSTVTFLAGALDEQFAQKYTVETERIVSEPEGNQVAKFNLNLISNEKQSSDQVDQQNQADRLPSILEFSPEAKAAGQDFALLEYDYSELEEQYAPSTLIFVWLNDQTGLYEELPTELDRDNNKISTKIQHFSSYSVTGQTAQHFAPTLKNWETNLYTGSVTYSIAIDTVPGIGGLTPGLTLTYNSNKANNLSHEDKGSWVGPGWDLTLPEIRFDSWTDKENSSCEDPASRNKGPQYSLIIGGTEEPLFWLKSNGCANDNCISANFISKSGKVTAVANYGSYNAKTRYNASGCSPSQGRNQIITKWLVTDSSGTTYSFDGEAYPSSVSDRIISGQMAPSKYMVTKIQDLSGNQVKFSYINDIEANHKVAVYPKEISYNNDRAKIIFTLGQKSSQPVITAKDDNNFEKQRLNKIEVYSNVTPGCTGPLCNELYRTYIFNYSTAGTEFKYGDDKGGGTTAFDALISIDKYIGPQSAQTKTISETFEYEQRISGWQALYLTSNKNKFLGHDDNGNAVYSGKCNAAWRGLMSWNSLSRGFININIDDNRGDCSRDEDQYDCICKDQQVKLKSAGWGDCLGTNKISENGANSTPATKNANCPTLAAFVGAYMGIGQGWIAGWEKARAPFIKSIRNGYGGRVDISYQTLNSTTPLKYAFVRNVVTQKVSYVEGWSEDKKLKEEYSYEASPLSQSLRPNAGGGFSRVTMKDPVTGMLTSTYYYPLASDNYIEEKHAVLDPEKNPLYGQVMRTVVHRYEGSKDRIYSDSFNSYSFIPAYNPNFGLDTAQNGKLTENVIANAVGVAVPVVADSFQPKDSNYVEIDKNDQSPQNISQSLRNDKFIHNQSISWFDRYGFPIKTATYGDVSGFADLNYDLNTARTVEAKWYEGDNAKRFTYGLPMNPYLYYGSTTKDIVKTGSPNADLSLRKYSYTKYLRSDSYASQNMFGLVAESFVSDVDASNFDNVAQDKRWSWSQVIYDQDGKNRGLATTQKTINTQKPNDRLASPDELIATTSYDQYGNPVEQTDARWNNGGSGGSKTITTLYTDSQYAYANILPREIKSVDKVGKELSKTTLTFNSFWQPETETDNNNIVAKAEYDCLGRAQKIYKPDPNTGAISRQPSTVYRYYDYQADGCGEGGVGNSPNIRTGARISSSGSDNIWTYTDEILDGLGNQLQTIVLKTKISDNYKSLVSETVYNNRGLKEQVSLPIEINLLDQNQAPRYQNLSLPACSNNHPNATCYEYDEMGRNTKVIDPLGNISTTEYLGVKTITKDANNSDPNKSNPISTVQAVNAFGQVTRLSVKNLANSNNPTYGLVTYNDYDILGNLTKTIQRKCNNPTCWPANISNEPELYSNKTYYDSLGRKWKIEDPDLGVWKTKYDANGNVTGQLDPKNQFIEFAYDNANRMIYKVYPGNPRAGLAIARHNVANYYDIGNNNREGQMVGKIWKMEDPSGEVEYWYDKRGRVTKERKIISKAITGGATDEETVSTFDYFESDAVKQTTISQNGVVVEQISNELNDVGQTERVKGSLGYYLESQTYNRFGAPEISKLGNGLETRFGYDSIGRMQRKCVGTKCGANGATILMDYLYGDRDKVGNILSVKNNIPNGFDYSYSYDGLYQLKSASGYDKEVSYSYDEEGNLLKKNEKDIVTLEYGGTGPRHAPKKVNGVNYRYDPNGNILEDEKRNYTWDYDNRPIVIAFKDGSVRAEFAYDGNGARVMKKVTSSDLPQATPTPASTPVGTNSCQIGDLDCSGAIDFNDYLNLTAKYNSGNATNEDLDRSGLVTSADIVLQFIYAGKAGSGATATPIAVVTPTANPGNLVTPSPTVRSMPTVTPTVRPTSYPTPSLTPLPTPTATPIAVVGSHRDGKTWCSNHGGIAKTVPYDIRIGDWTSCLAWCDSEMSASLPLCQYNSDGPRNCWVNYPPGGPSGNIQNCNWLPGPLPYGAWWSGYEN